MIDASTVALLQKHIRRTGRSLLQYVTESFPWTGSAKDEEIVRNLHQMQAEEQQYTAAMVEFLLAQNAAPPYLGAYPMHFTTLNYLAVPRLLEELRTHQKADIVELESDISELPEGDAKELLQKLYRCKKDHLAQMQQMVDAPTAVAS